MKTPRMIFCLLLLYVSLAVQAPLKLIPRVLRVSYQIQREQVSRMHR